MVGWLLARVGVVEMYFFAADERSRYFPELSTMNCCVHCRVLEKSLRVDCWSDVFMLAMPYKRNKSILTKS